MLYFLLPSLCPLPGWRSEKQRLKSPIDWTPPLHKTLKDTESDCIKGFALRLKELKMLAFSKHINNWICWAWALTLEKSKLSFSLFLSFFPPLIFLPCCLPWYSCLVLIFLPCCFVCVCVLFFTNDIVFFIYMKIRFSGCKWIWSKKAWDSVLTCLVEKGLYLWYMLWRVLSFR